jgi:pyruvate, orthophosphate dikinase
VSGEPVRTGDLVTVDGGAGVVYRGFSGPAGAAPVADAENLGGDLEWLLEQAARQPGIGVQVNADTAAAAAAGRDHGASGVGLCRIEHMLLGSRKHLLERVLLSPPGAETTEALAALEDLLRADFVAILDAMDGLPVTIRLLDPPRHEFLPDLTELAVAAAVADRTSDPGQDRLAAVRRLWERNPMLGVRGVRLATIVPGLTAMQVAAIMDATASLRRAGGDPRPQLLVPMVTLPREIDLVRRQVHDLCQARGMRSVPVGAMSETPRAALLAGALAQRVDFLSIGTNDLTGLVWGLSRDDADRHLLPRYEDLGLIDTSPFVQFDVEGVGELVRTAVTDARAVKPDLPVGVCGEHAADPSAVAWFSGIGVDYVSCAPAQVPVARLASARAALAAGDRRTGGRRDAEPR